jgi:hypothetical protein
MELFWIFIVLSLASLSFCFAILLVTISFGNSLREFDLDISDVYEDEEGNYPTPLLGVVAPNEKG